VTGGALPGATVTARNTATGLTRTATSAADGQYVLAGVPAGQYELTTSLTGFQTMHAVVRVSVDETVTFPIEVDLGIESAGVVVLGAVINARTPELSFLVGEKTIATLPLNGRNYTDLALLQPGVLPYPSRDGGS